MRRAALASRPPWNQRFRSLDATDVRRLQALGALDDVELHLLALAQGAKALRHDRGVMDKHVRRAITGDEPKPLRIVEPLHGASFHDSTLLLWDPRRPL